jgi:hypothetical protein
MLKKINSIIIIFGVILLVSCSKDKTKNKESSKVVNEIDSVEKIDVVSQNGLNYVKIFMIEGSQFSPNEREGYIIKHQNNITTGCFFEYNLKNRNVRGIYEFSNSELNDYILNFNYNQVSLDYLKTGKPTSYIAQGEIYNQYMLVKKQKITDSTSVKNWKDVESFKEYYKMNELPKEALEQLPELAKFINFETLKPNKNVPMYSEIRGTLIQETNISLLEEMMGKPDEIFDNKNLEWNVYYFAVQKNGIIGHLVFRINGIHPRLIDEITFYNPGDKIRMGYSYFVSPINKQ